MGVDERDKVHELINDRGNESGTKVVGGGNFHFYSWLTKLYVLKYPLIFKQRTKLLQSTFQS